MWVAAASGSRSIVSVLIFGAEIQLPSLPGVPNGVKVGSGTSGGFAFRSSSSLDVPQRPQQGEPSRKREVGCCLAGSRKCPGLHVWVKLQRQQPWTRRRGLRGNTFAHDDTKDKLQNEPLFWFLELSVVPEARKSTLCATVIYVHTCASMVCWVSRVYNTCRRHGTAVSTSCRTPLLPRKLMILSSHTLHPEPCGLGTREVRLGQNQICLLLRTYVARSCSPTAITQGSKLRARCSACLRRQPFVRNALVRTRCSRSCFPVVS